MPFWIFGRNPYHKRVERLEKTLNNSFSNIKNDILHLNSQLHDSKNKHESHEKRLEKIEGLLENLLSEMHTIKSEEISQIEQEQEEIKLDIDKLDIDKLDMLDELTETQKTLFATIFSLQDQMGTDKVSLKSIAKIAYPEKDYLKIRSTISQYLTVLEEWNLVEKRRRGKESYVGVTDLGKNIIQKIKKEKVTIKNRKS